MKIEYKSAFLGIFVGVGILGCLLLIIGYSETELSISNGKQDNIQEPEIQLQETKTIISYNIRYDNKLDEENNWLLRRNRLCQFLKDYKPSIFGIQEGLVNQVAFIDSSLPKYEYIGVGRDDGKMEGEFCAIFYDTSYIENKENSTFWLSETPDVVSVGWDAALERICTYGLFIEKLSGEIFWVFNTHFDHIGEISRKKSSELILEKIKEINIYSYPVILMGDFNLIPESEPIRLIKSQLDDALEISSTKWRGPIGTFNGFDIQHPLDKRIDYIFTTNYKIISHRHIDDRLNNNSFISDHLPVMVELQIK